jgi:hypothetical protein
VQLIVSFLGPKPSQQGPNSSQHSTTDGSSPSGLVLLGCGNLEGFHYESVLRPMHGRYRLFDGLRNELAIRSVKPGAQLKRLKAGIVSERDA